MTDANKTTLSRPEMPPFRLIESFDAWQACLNELQQASRVAVDLEANSMFAYREQVCLLQISLPHQDYIIDPMSLEGLPGFGTILENPAIEKIFHSAEYDLILLKREYGWEVQNIFDTMWAARILGYNRLGLASLLAEEYRVKLNKRYQRSDWCQRPLHEPQLIYAQADTHYLLSLRERLAARLKAGGHWEEAQEIFAEQSQITLSDNSFDPDSFWSIGGAQKLPPTGQAILRALHIYRDQLARARNQPLFKIFGDQTLIELASKQPEHLSELNEIYGMTPRQIQRYGRQLIHIIKDSKKSSAPRRPRRAPRPPEAVLERYDTLHNWRKARGVARGVESDVILNREQMWEIARLNPQSVQELADANILGPWRLKTYGQDIIHLLGKKQ